MHLPPLLLWFSSVVVGMAAFLRAPVTGSTPNLGAIWDLLGAGGGALFALHVWRGRFALELLFGPCRSGTERAVYTLLWFTAGALGLLQLLPGWPQLTAVLLFGLHAFLFTRTKLWSIENILFQNLFFHLAFARLGVLAELDAPRAASPWQACVLTSLIVHLGLIMFSGAVEKLRSPVWIRGEGTSAFLRQRHLVTPAFRTLSRLPVAVTWPLSHLTLGAELLMLPAALHPSTLAATVTVLLGFAITLFTVVDISFIGQILVLQLAAILSALPVFSHHADLQPAAAPSYLQGVLIASMIVTCTAIHLPNASAALHLNWFQHALTGINGPIRVFTEAHLVDTMIYRLSARTTDGQEFPQPQVFKIDGSPGPLQRWSPRYFQSAMYRLARIRRSSASGAELNAGDRAFVTDLATSLFRLRPDSPTDMILELWMSPTCQGLEQNPSWERFARLELPVSRPHRLSIFSYPHA